MTDAPEGSQLGSLLARRQEIADAQVKKLRVPRWDEPEIVVSYRPIEPREFASFLNGLEENLSPEDRAEDSLNRNADLLIKACLGIDARSEGPDGINKHWDTFGPELGEALGFESGTATARQICRKLFVAGGDLLSTSTSVVRWSKVASSEVDEGFSGE